MPRIHVYRTYNFIEKDPICDKARTALQDALGERFVSRVAKLSGVAYSTAKNIFEGPTRRPQFATIAAMMTAAGYTLEPRRGTRIDEEAELKKAAEWIAKGRHRAIVPTRRGAKSKKKAA
ncbi:MAG: hypothetical protein EHM78_02335 [Myxococcaceae bacterium]|nr:MAG: hypothetical protein EHM78_02335 [Myxococcaceae bacterium]